jgi:hypothetical protein
MGRFAVFVCCDGLGRDWVRPDYTPALWEIRQASLWCDAHQAVFPSVTRVSAASVATGCRAARHGLHGNRMGLIEQGRIVVRDVGKPDFRAWMRDATGGTLKVPTIAERVAAHGGFIGFSNVSPGAAYFLDPEHFGYVYHRAGSWAPGGDPVAAADALSVSHDLAGDRAMTARFCAEVLDERRPAVAVLWLANPDLTLHGQPLGSAPHLEALREADQCVREVHRAVQRRRQRGDDILFLAGSDHGQETIGDCVDLDAWLAIHGLGAALEAGDIAVAGQGTAALLYATPRGHGPLLAVLDVLRKEPWVDDMLVGDDLARRGHAATGGVAAAINMARREDANPWGVPGSRWTVAEPGKPAALGCGQHGGWGPDETRPFLLVNGAGVAAGSLRQPTSLTDIAPTILRFLELPVAGMEGAPLPA